MPYKGRLEMPVPRGIESCAVAQISPKNISRMQYIRIVVRLGIRADSPDRYDVKGRREIRGIEEIVCYEAFEYPRIQQCENSKVL